MSGAPDPGRVLRRAILAWGLGHLALGRTATGAALLATELMAVALVAWLGIGLAGSSLYLVPYLAGVVFLVAWAWQAVAAYRAARGADAAIGPTPERSPATAIGWLSLPLLAWGTGFWLVGAGSATPAAVLDRFVTDWTAGDLHLGSWPPDVADAAELAAAPLGADRDRLRDVRVSIVDGDGANVAAVAEAIHYERRDTSFLWIFPGSELVPVADDELLVLDLVAVAAPLPGGADVGAVRWELVSATRP